MFVLTAILNLPVQAAVSGRVQKEPWFVKMGVLEDVSGESIRSFAEWNIAEGSVVRTDGFSSYPKALGGQYEHKPERLFKIFSELMALSSAG